MATFDNENNVEEKWKTLIGQLAGLFCISLNQLDLKNSFTPEWLLPMYQPIGAHEKSRRRVGFLPREVACTENLVPWRKLLPTGDSHGLGAFLTNPHHQLKKSSYWSISVRFNSQSESTSSLVLEHSMIVDVRNRNTLDILTNFNSTDNEPKEWFILRVVPALDEINLRRLRFEPMKDNNQCKSFIRCHRSCSFKTRHIKNKSFNLRF